MLNLFEKDMNSQNKMTGTHLFLHFNGHVWYTVVVKSDVQFVFNDSIQAQLNQ